MDVNLSSKTAPSLLFFDFELVTATVFCILGLVGLWLVNTPWFWQQVYVDKGGVLMGQIVSKSGDVRYRPQGIPLWMDVLNGERTQAYSGGAVFSGPRALASIDLVSGPLLDIEENTLVLLEVNLQGDAKIAVGESNIKLTFRGKGESVELVAAGQSIRIVSKKKNVVLDATIKNGKLTSNGLESADFEVSRQAVTDVKSVVDTEVIAKVDVANATLAPLAPVVATTAWWNTDSSADMLRVEIRHTGKVRLMAGEDEIAETTAEQGAAVFLLNEKDAARVRTYIVEGLGQGTFTVEYGAPRITKIIAKENKLLVVWRKTVFTSAYNVGFCHDVQCKRATHEEVTNRNFTAVKATPKKGGWVRVRSVYVDGPGVWSAAIKLEASLPR